MNRITVEKLVDQTGAPWGRESFGVVVVSAVPQTACVFVHGWGGRPTNTWFGFPTRLRTLEKPVDFFYYGYDSVRKSAAYSAAKFRAFLRAVLSDPNGAVLSPSVPQLPQLTASRGSGFRYGRIVLCCHSLGAIVARRALIDLEAELAGSVTRADIRMLLFAPAHSGSDMARLAQEIFAIGTFRMPLALAGTLAAARLKSLRDLVPGSNTLQALETDNSNLCKQIRTATGSPPSFLPRVLHGGDDVVVVQNDFPGDPPFQPVDEQSHTSICKPTNSYLRPVSELTSLL